MKIKLDKKVKEAKVFFGLYIETSLVNEIRSIAKSQEVSISKLVATILKKAITELEYEN